MHPGLASGLTERVSYILSGSEEVRDFEDLLGRETTRSLT